MKQSLIILTSLATVAFSSSTTVNFINNTTTNELSSKPEPAQTPPSLFNNTFGYLSQDKWITNQSTTDHKYYSYDTSHVVSNLSDGTPTRNAFIVDNTGSLTINSKLNLSNVDKNMLNNIQAQMISHKQVTSIKDDYNVYSKSIYSDNYFSDNSSWKYLQMGGLENHIDISSQQSANKVDNRGASLSETLGLYYIAKAERTNRIDSTVANSLGKDFISKSSLKNLDDSLTSSIINVVATNADAYNLIANALLSDGKNYSINYIFDNSHNLIEIYYNEFNKSNIENNLNYKWNYSYSWFGSDSPNQDVLIKWSDYAKNWDLVTKIFPTFNFNNNSYLKLILLNDKRNIYFPSANATNKVKSNQESFYNFSLSDSFGRYHYNANFNLNIWHDNDNIYYKWALNYNGKTNLNVNLNNVIFFNVMN
ncbi:hypothetical protein [Spiroplasma endosymbiont of Nebria brevicollis]|uniref:hypothetical protein n=1 Tax=Spiroplasma endosymbiont of Nebria brevicollis TaxID=3066284 RepID=UPI00313AD7DA